MVVVLCLRMMILKLMRAVVISVPTVTKILFFYWLQMTPKDTWLHFCRLVPSLCFRSPTAILWTIQWSTTPTCSAVETPVLPIYPISLFTPPSQACSPPFPLSRGRRCCAAHGACSKIPSLPVRIRLRPRRDTILTYVQVTQAPSTRTTMQRTARNETTVAYQWQWRTCWATSRGF